MAKSQVIGCPIPLWGEPSMTMNYEEQSKPTMNTRMKREKQY
jgi:hypothetical protein